MLSRRKRTVSTGNPAVELGWGAATGTFLPIPDGELIGFDQQQRSECYARPAHAASRITDYR